MKLNLPKVNPKFISSRQKKLFIILIQVQYQINIHLFQVKIEFPPHSNQTYGQWPMVGYPILKLLYIRVDNEVFMTYFFSLASESIALRLKVLQS